MVDAAHYPVIKTSSLYSVDLKVVQSSRL